MQRSGGQATEDVGDGGRARQALSASVRHARPPAALSRGGGPASASVAAPGSRSAMETGHGFCLTQVSQVRLVAGALAVSVVLWLAILAVL
ncbi:MAG: hypothetical protein AAF882_17985 [Pseudomonadota bacterium]